MAYYSIYGNELENLDADIVLASTYTVCELLKQYVPDYDNIVIANITAKGFRRPVAGRPSGTQAPLL